MQDLAARQSLAASHHGSATSEDDSAAAPHDPTTSEDDSAAAPHNPTASEDDPNQCEALLQALYKVARLRFGKATGAASLPQTTSSTSALHKEAINLLNNTDSSNDNKIKLLLSSVINLQNPELRAWYKTILPESVYNGLLEECDEHIKLLHLSDQLQQDLDDLFLVLKKYQYDDTVDAVLGLLAAEELKSSGEMSLAVRVVKQVVQGLLKQKKGRTMINLTIYSHLNRQYDVDYLQDGDLKWDVPADDSMTDKLCKYRRDSIKGAKKNRFLSDIRLLSILNIFPYGHLQGSYSICEVIEGIDCQKVCCPASPIVEIDGPSQAIKALRIDIVRGTPLERKTSTPTATTIKPTAITNQVVLRILDQWRFSLVERLGQLVEYNRESVLFPTCLSFHFTIIGKYV